MIDSERFAQVLRGFWLLAKLEEGGLSFFEKTYAGFLRSFFPALILAPLHAIHAAAQYMTATPAPSLSVTVIVETLAYILTCTLFPFVMMYVTRSMNKADRFLTYIVPYNWLQLPIGLVVLPLILLADFQVLDNEAIGALNFIILGLFVMYGTFLALIALDVKTSTAFGIVVLDIVLGLLSDTLIDQIPKG